MLIDMGMPKENTPPHIHKKPDLNVFVSVLHIYVCTLINTNIKPQTEAQF